MPAAFSPRQAFLYSLKKVLISHFINLFESFELTHTNIVFAPFHLGKHLPAYSQAHDLELCGHLLLGQTRPVPEPAQILSDREVLSDFQFTVPLPLEWISSILMLQYFCVIIGMYTFQFEWRDAGMYHQASPSKEHSEETNFTLSEELLSFLNQYRRLIPELQPLLRWVVTNGDLLPRLLPAEHIPRSTLDELISLATKREDPLLLILALCARCIKDHPTSPCV